MNKHLVLIVLIAFVSKTNAQVNLSPNYFNSLDYQHDLNLPNWGPYTKKYIGVSHIADRNKGIRFDLSIFPGFYRRKVNVPNVYAESDFHPWEASPNLEYFSFRHDLEWKDKVYTDVSYAKIDAHARAIQVECVNNTNMQQSIVLHFMSSIHFPSLKAYSADEPIKPAIINLPKDALWVDALDYQKLNTVTPNPKDELVTDGQLKGELRANDLVNGSGIQFGNEIGDEVRYFINVPKNINNAVLILRYKSNKTNDSKIELSGLLSKEILLKSTPDYSLHYINLDEVKRGKHYLNLKSKGGVIDFDGLIIANKNDVDAINIYTPVLNKVPEIIKGPIQNSIILKYQNIDNYYGLYWDYPDFKVREWFYKDLSDEFKRMVNDHVSSKFYDGSDGHYSNVFLRPINIKPNSKKTIYGLVCEGNLESVIARIKETDATHLSNATKEAKKFLVNYNNVPAGDKYLFSQKRMAATIITNVVFPVYMQKQYIRHHTPGRWWDSLYTWDSGFIGMGLSELNIQRGIENLNAYMNDTDEQSAFIHHGTPLPVQHYLFLELWNKTQSKDLLKAYYPKLKRYYDFLIGNISSSSTRNLNSGLIRTWDYFYNSGGWDDYPAQKFVHEQKLTKNTTPVVSTAHLIRIAKILQMTAHHLNLKNDVRTYENDIQELSSALNKYSWDEASGYYGYVVHNKNEDPEEILKYKDSINFNMGLDGASPLVAGICNDIQRDKIVAHLKTRGELWSDIGLSAVDQSAAYYSKNGYWNGTVWMPHQWFFWKSMLDIGEADFANKIATTALDLWKRETEQSYNCYEHFVIETGRGAGWHQFGGLSSPVLSWFNAYYQQGTITTGFNIWIEEKKFKNSNSQLNAKLSIFDTKNKVFSIIVCLNPTYSYDVYWEGKKVEYKEINKGTLSIILKNGSNQGLLKIRKK